MEGGDREAPEVVWKCMKYHFVYLNVVTVCLNEMDSVCLNGWAGQGKHSHSLKYLFVCLKIRIFKCSYRSCKGPISQLMEAEIASFP